MQEQHQALMQKLEEFGGSPAKPAVDLTKDILFAQADAQYKAHIWTTKPKKGEKKPPKQLHTVDSNEVAVLPDTYDAHGFKWIHHDPSTKILSYNPEVKWKIKTKMQEVMIFKGCHRTVEISPYWYFCCAFPCCTLITLYD